MGGNGRRREDALAQWRPHSTEVEIGLHCGEKSTHLNMREISEYSDVNF